MISAMSRVMAGGNSEELWAATLKPQPKLKVFIVEDELLNVEFYRSLLAVLSNRFQTYEFKDGDEAWAALSKMDPDILITDLLHPGLDGWELLKQLSAKKAAYPILVISGDCQAEEYYRSCHPGLNLNILGKPFDLRAFHNHLSELLEKHDRLMIPVESDRSDFDSAGAAPSA